MPSGVAASASGPLGTASEELAESPLKANDHAMDATRYALHTALNRARAAEAYLETYLGWHRPSAAEGAGGV